VALRPRIRGSCGVIGIWKASGENIEIGICRHYRSGEYHITKDPCEKERPGSRSRRRPEFDRNHGPILQGRSLHQHERNDLSHSFRWDHREHERIRPCLIATSASSVPPNASKDLAELVTVRVVRNEIHMDYRTDFLRVTSNTVLVPITVQVPNRDLSFQTRQGVHSAVLNLYGRITTPGGVVVQTFEDVISRDFPESLFQSSLNLSSVYQKSLRCVPASTASTSSLKTR